MSPKNNTKKASLEIFGLNYKRSGVFKKGFHQKFLKIRLAAPETLFIVKKYSPEDSA